MSGHSHFATIKRQKAANDMARGKIYSRHSKSIAIAIKAGGSANPELNSKLRFAIEQAKADNMPRANIDRILQKAAEAGNLEEVTYEGYGPFGIAILVKVATDNRNRTAQEIKGIFERGGGSLGGPGSVLFNFESKGLLVIKKSADSDTQLLELIDSGVEDVDEAGDVVEAYVPADKLGQVKDVVFGKGGEIISYKLTMKPKNTVVVDDLEKAQKVIALLDRFEDQDDVQDVYSNFDVTDDIAQKLN